MWKLLIAAIIALTLFIQPGSAIKCFACTSNADDPSNCGDPFGGTTATCDLILGGEAVCLKSTLAISYSESTLRTTTRACHLKSANICEILQGSLPTSTTLEHCSTCTTDLCNGGPKSIAVSLSALLLVAGATLKHVLFV